MEKTGTPGPAQKNNSTPWFGRITLILGCIITAIGFAVLAGYISNIPVLKSFVPGAQVMKANTAISFIITGFCIILSARENVGRMFRLIKTCLSPIIITIGFVTLLEHIFGADLFIDNIIAGGGRMPPSLAVSFILIGTSFLLADIERFCFLIQVFSAAILIVVLINFIDIAYAGYLHAEITFPKELSIPTSIAMALTAIGIFVMRPRCGIMPLITSASPVGYMTRRFLLSAFIVFFVLGFIRVRGEHYEFYDTAYGTTLMVISGFVLLAAIIIYISNSVERIDARRRNVEKALVNSELRYRTLVESIPARIFHKDRNSVYVFCNRRFAEDLEIKSGEIAGKTDYDFFSTELAGKYRKNDLMVMNRDWTGDFEEETFLHGQKKVIHTVKAPVKDEAGNIVGLIGIFWDITESKKMEEKLDIRMQFEHFVTHIAQNFLNVPLGRLNIAIDRALRLAGSFFGVDRTYLFIYDYSSETMSNTHEWCSEGITPQINNLQKLPFKGIEKWVDTHNRGEMMHIPRVKDFGNERIREILEAQDIRSIIALPLISRGKAMGFIGLDSVRVERTWQEEEIGMLKSLAEAFANVLERQRREQELRRAREEAETANRTKSDFLASMSHELRTPLNSIIGFSEVLEDQLFGNLNEKQKKYVENVLESSKHLLGLIDDILDLSKIEAGRIGLELEKTALKDVLEGSLAMFREKAEEKGLKIKLEIESRADIQIKADKRKLKQMVLNLLSNAVKFTQRGGLINVRAKRIDEQYLRISVQDTGVGIKEEDREKLFQAFGKIEAFIFDEKYEGTGLGLAITKKLAEMHGGRAWCESEGEGRGSTFYIEIPIK